MAAPKSVHARVSTTLERLERLMGEVETADIDHATPETVEEAVRRLKGKLPEKSLRQIKD